MLMPYAFYVDGISMKIYKIDFTTAYNLLFH
jgi:hypothetical protein